MMENKKHRAFYSVYKNKNKEEKKEKRKWIHIISTET